MLPCDPTKAESTNTGFIDRWNRQKQSKEIEMFGRVDSDICNVSKFLLPGIKLQIKFTKAKPSFYLMNTAADSKTTFKFLDAKLIVKRIRANPKIPLAHEQTLKTELARYDLTRVELKTFTFSAGPQSLDRSGGHWPHTQKAPVHYDSKHCLSRYRQHKPLQFSTFRSSYIRDVREW